MSTGLLTCVALLGALAGLAAPRAARHFVAPVPPAVPYASGAPHVPAAPVRRYAPVGRYAPGTPHVPAEPHAPGMPQVSVGRQVSVAMAGAVVFSGLAMGLGADPVLPVFLVLAAVGLVLALVDLACLRLPDPLVGTAALVVAVGLTGAALMSGSHGRLLGAVGGAALCFGCHVVLALLPGSRLGFGDVKLAAVLGLPLGWLGGSPLLFGLFLPHLLHGVVVLALLVAGRIRRSTPLPLGPALLTGAWLATLTP